MASTPAVGVSAQVAGVFTRSVAAVHGVRASYAGHVHAGHVHAGHAAVLLSATSPTPSTFKPTSGALPGGAALLHLVDGLGGWALMLALAGLVIGAALWAIGAHSQNYQQSYVGRRAVLVSGVAALLIGAAPTLINFFFNTGHGIVNPLPQ